MFLWTESEQLIAFLYKKNKNQKPMNNNSHEFQFNFPYSHKKPKAWAIKQQEELLAATKFPHFVRPGDAAALSCDWLLMDNPIAWDQMWIS